MTELQEREIIRIRSKISTLVLQALDSRLGCKVMDSLSDEKVISLQEAIEKAVSTVLDRAVIQGLREAMWTIEDDDLAELFRDGKTGHNIAKESLAPRSSIYYKIKKIKEKECI